VVKKVLPAVVSIESRTRARRPRGEGDDTTPLGFGSGFLIDPKGVILTNYHVVDGADRLDVTLMDGRRYTTRDIKSDPKTDLAVVRINPKKPLPYLELGDSDQMEIGDRVLAVGAPFGLTGSVTAGIISAKNRNLRVNMYEDFLQTDAAINPGNSGGPLVNLAGQVIGIDSAIKSRTGGFQGVGLAIASNLVRKVKDQLLKDGVVRRGYLGIQVSDIETEEQATKLGLREPGGVLVESVFEDTPGEKAGLRMGDVILSLGGKPIKNSRGLLNAVSDLPLGKPVTVDLRRDGKDKTLKVTIEEQPQDYGTRKPRPQDDDK
jgi:serine protease Do